MMDTVIPVAIGKNLMALRKRAHLTQDAVAKGMGTSASHVSAVERGARNLNVQTIMRYARACGYGTELTFAPLEEDHGIAS